MVTTIPLVGLAANDPVPGNYIAVNFAQGPSSGGTGEYSAVLLGNMLSTGAAQADGYIYGPDTETQLATEEDAVNLFGRGSELHLMWKAFVAVNKSTSVYAVAVTESAGSQATGTITITAGSDVTAPGTIRVTIGTTVIDTGIATGDTDDEVATAVAASINVVSNLPVTAAASTNTVVITAKQKGLRGNFIRYSAMVSPVTGTGTTVTPTARTLFTGGNTADDNTAALATIGSSRYYYQVSAAEDATQLGALATQVDSMANPITGLRQRVFGGAVGTLGATTTVATGINSARCEIVWLQNADYTPAELAANNAAVYALFETGLGAQSSLNYDSFGSDAATAPYWTIKAPLSGTVPSRNTIKSALLNGITPIGVLSAGRTQIVKRITSRSLNGAVADYRIRDAHKVTVCDFYADALLAKANAQFAGKVIGNDPAVGQRIPGPTVVTPRMFKSMIDSLTSEYANKDLLQNVAEIQANTQVVREVSPSTRLSARVPLQVIDVLDSTGTNVDEVSAG